MWFNDKVALITGSTSGIGLSMAQALVESGASVVISGFASEDEVQKILKDLASSGKGHVEFFGGDLTKLADIEALVHFTQERFGRIDMLVNNAGMQHVCPIEDFPIDKWDKLIALNLTAPFHFVRLILPMMRKNGFGRIINVASTHGFIASKGKSAYVATKHGIIGLTKVIALETATENITCNALCPGFVLTPLVEAQIRETMTESGLHFDAACEAFVGDKHPSKKFVPVSDITGACMYLLGEHASQIKGAQIIVDGGWTIY